MNQAPIARVRKSVRKYQRVKTDQSNEVLRSMTEAQKVQHLRQSVCDARMQAAIESGRGRPPMVERLLAAASIVDELESSGVPLRVGRNSRMNKELRSRLHEDAVRSKDGRKSRNRITADATRDLLRDVRFLRYACDHFAKMRLY